MELLWGESLVLGQAVLSCYCEPAEHPVFRLPALIGLSRAMDMILTGRLLEPKDALGENFIIWTNVAVFLCITAKTSQFTLFGQLSIICCSKFDLFFLDWGLANRVVATGTGV